MNPVLAEAANESIDELFTWTALATLWGAALATFVVGNAVGALFGFWNRGAKYLRLWMAFLVAMAIELGVAAAASGDYRKWIVGALNGFLVFTSAMGLNEGVDKLPKPPPPALDASERRALVASWLRPSH